MNELILLPCSVRRGGESEGETPWMVLPRVRCQLAKYIIRKLPAGKMNVFLARVFRPTVAIFDNFRRQVLQFWEGATWPIKAFARDYFRVRWRVHTLSWPFYNIVSFFFFFFSFSKRSIFSVSSVFRHSSCKKSEFRLREGLNVFDIFLVLVLWDTTLITKFLFIEV